jgi:hypothetical protein
MGVDAWHVGKHGLIDRQKGERNKAPANDGAVGKVGGPAEELPSCLGSAESATADFSQAPLMVSWSSLLMC